MSIQRRFPSASSSAFSTHLEAGGGACTGAGGRGAGGGEGEGRGGGGGLGAALTHTMCPGWRPSQSTVGFMAMKSSSSMPEGRHRRGPQPVSVFEAP